jgi:hypothetical protein
MGWSRLECMAGEGLGDEGSKMPAEGVVAWYI